MSVRLLAATALVLACLCGCPSSSSTKPTRPTRLDDSALRIRIAQAEARRADGLVELTELATTGPTSQRVLALRGLGRIGGPKAIDTLLATLRGGDAELIGAAATSLGLLASLDEDDAGTRGITAALIAALPGSKPHEVEVIEAIGRAAGPDASAQLVLATELSNRPPDAIAAAAFALGRYGRRKIPLIDRARDELVVATRHADVRVRYAAAYALAREQLPKPPAGDDAKTPKGPDPRALAANAQLGTLIRDPDPAVRAIAIAALGRRKSVIDSYVALVETARDPDWRVAVEAIRTLTGEGGDEQTRGAAAFALLDWLVWSEVVRGNQPIDPHPVWKKQVDGEAAFEALEHVFPGPTITRLPEQSSVQVVLEGLRDLAPHAKDKSVRTAMVFVQRYASASKVLPALTRGWIECLAQANLIRGADVPSYLQLGPDYCHLPDHLSLPLVAELVTAKVGSVGQRREALRPLIGHGDARVRVAGMTALASLWEDGNELDHRATAATVIAALDSKDPLVAGTAVDAATAIYEAGAKDLSAGWREGLDAAVVARAQTEKEAELAASLFELIGKRAIAAGAPACREGSKGAPVLAKAAANCLKALGQPVDAPTIAGAKAPPVDVSQVIGKRVFWHLATTRGEIVIELAPEVAPWAVATIVTLTRKGFHDGLELHRVVPDFVVQGGDPTQSGWGGPGFTMPAEPSTGAGFVGGGVGIADAGRDSGGSQWFVMHSASPHLDGRYTWVGKVVSGQKSADALLIGDRVVRATIELGSRL